MPKQNQLDGVNGARLRELRMQRALTGMKVAAVIGVSRYQLYKYETSKSDVPASRLEALADLYQCEVTDLYLPVGTNQHRILRRRRKRVDIASQKSSAVRCRD